MRLATVGYISTDCSIANTYEPPMPERLESELDPFGPIGWSYC